MGPRRKLGGFKSPAHELDVGGFCILARRILQDVSQLPITEILAYVLDMFFCVYSSWAEGGAPPDDFFPLVVGSLRQRCSPIVTEAALYGEQHGEAH